ncbi:DUF389 domain-containing protein [Lewinella sp. 4G2]|uniref:DUF389 domain-containing protein n=1 Tax=Lewinella sp. 4G2 TaxID=1803372 RepID=UPI0007B4B5F7|nr:DUF389 domain-containing protein [Lewinella sp. 4G2]OAV44468.1 hypothetical protein A3850_008180 [Lewinella sp. 4G2]
MADPKDPKHPATPLPSSTNEKEVTPGEGLAEWFHDFLDLRTGSDRAGAVESIISGKQMRGSNAWMLVCSILIASLGLNLNSGAVIIGAMLISPLMNPILGIGLGVGTNDTPLLWKALQNFGISIAIALTASVLYFALTPIDTFTPEMQARTEPTILDALVAVFGGLAGIISVTRKDKTNAIPGVAIATALMPPLCVAGYGIALALTDPAAGFQVFWRSSYLFFINSFFIAATAYVIIRLLRFPYRKYLTKADARKSMLIVGAISILMIIPSVYILSDVLVRLRENEAAKSFTETFFPASSSSYLLDRENKAAPLLIYPIKNRLMSRDSIDHYTKILREPPYGLTNARIVTDTSLSASAMASIQRKLSTVSNHQTRLSDVEYRLQLLAQEVAQLEELPAQFRDTVAFNRTRRQLIEQFPMVTNLALSRAKVSGDTLSSNGDLPLAVVSLERPGRRPPLKAIKQEKAALQQFLQVALGRDSVILIVEEQ